MKYLSIDCVNCESKYTIEYGEDNPMEDEPSYCPFCGEDINDDLYENRAVADEDYDGDDIDEENQ